MCVYIYIYIYTCTHDVINTVTIILAGDLCLELIGALDLLGRSLRYAVGLVMLHYVIVLHKLKSSSVILYHIVS